MRLSPTTKATLPAALLFAAALCFPGTASATAILANAVQTTTLAPPSSGCYMIGLAYDTANGQYYGEGSGNPICNGLVWNSGGALLQNIRPLNIDGRGMFYDPNTNSIQNVTYGASGLPGPLGIDYGLIAMGLNGSGLYTGANTQLLAIVPGIADSQSVAAYNPTSDAIYSRVSNNIVDVASHSTGALLTTITLNFAAAGNPSMQAYSIGYDPVTDTFLTVSAVTKDAYVFGNTGAYLGSSYLGAGTPIDGNYDLAYTNGQLFVTDGSSGIGTWRGFDIFASQPVPEPTSLALLCTGLAALGLIRRRKRETA